MEPCSSSPPSPVSTSLPQWMACPSRIRDSASRPRRSLVSSDFGGPLQEGWEESPSPPPSSSIDGLLSKSCLPSPPISEEEEALEPTTPPHVATFLVPVPPLAPRKSFKYRVAPRGKHRPRRLFLGGGGGGEGEAVEGAHFSGPNIHIHIHGDLTPPHPAFNCFLPSQAPNPFTRINKRGLR